MPLAIARESFWAVSEHVLVTKLNTNLCGDIFQVVRVVDRERAAACEFRDIVQQLGAQTFFFSRKIVVICTDCVDHYSCFLYQVLYLAFCVSAAIVTSVRDDQQRFPLVFCPPHFPYCEITGLGITNTGE